jgi:UDP-glucose 4-epimerase
MTVDQIVDTILEAAQISIKKKYLGGNKGWKGDNNFVHLDNQKLKSLGWKPTKTQREGIRRTVDYLLANPNLLN